MAEVVESQTFQLPVSVVWAALADFGAISRWAPNVDHSCLTTATAAGMGATRRVQAGRNTVLETVTEWEPERCLAYSIDGLPPIVRSVTNSWNLVESGAMSDAVTEVTLTTQIDTGPRPPQQMAARVLRRAFRNTSRQMLSGLDAHLQTMSQGIS